MHTVTQIGSGLPYFTLPGDSFFGAATQMLRRIDVSEQKPLKLWWIPQVPMKAFEVEIASVAEGVKLLDVLANYDLFQFENKVKPDYCNVGGIVMLEDGEWVDWYDEATGEDDPKVYVADQSSQP